MKTLPTRFLICAALALCSAGTALAGGHGGHSSSSAGFAARPAARSGAGVGFQSAGARYYGSARANFRGVNSFSRNGVRWNSGPYRSANVVRSGNARWNGVHNGQWANNWHHNGNGNWNHHHRGNQIVFIGGYGYCPWYFPYDSYPYYGYPYGAYQGAYGYDSGYGYDQPVYDGNNVDENYGAPVEDKGSYPNGSSNYRGSSSVAEVQRLLARAGFYKGAIDGAMGSRTFYAIRAYQRSHNLQVDGQIGPQLLSSLGRS
jgi:hypothetical protein